MKTTAEFLVQLPVISTEEGLARQLAFLGYPEHWVTVTGTLWSTKKKTPIKLRGTIKPHGYRDYVLVYDTLRHIELAHRLTARAWIPNPEDLPCVLHKEESLGRDCCVADNLFWGTPKDNTQDMQQKGRGCRSGELSATCKISDQELQTAILEIYAGSTIAEQGRKYGIRRETISEVLRQKSRRSIWKDLPETVLEHFSKKYQWEEKP